MRGLFLAALAISVPSSYGRNLEKLPKQADRADAIFVAQREQAVVRFDQGLIDYGLLAHSLKTAGLNPCIGVILYDPQTKTGALAHVDQDTGRTLRMAISGLQNQFSQAAGFSSSGLSSEIKKRLDIYVVSGGNDSTLREILSLLQADGFPLAQINEVKAMNVSLDLATGQLSEFTPDRNLYDLRRENVLLDLGRTKFPPDGHFKNINPCELSLMQKR